MFILLWFFLAVLTVVAVIMFVGDRLLKESLTHEGLCPMCGGEGGPCETCNGLGVIVDPAKSQLSQFIDSSTKIKEKSLR